MGPTSHPKPFGPACPGSPAFALRREGCACCMAFHSPKFGREHRSVRKAQSMRLYRSLQFLTQARYCMDLMGCVCHLSPCSHEFSHQLCEMERVTVLYYVMK